MALLASMASLAAMSGQGPMRAPRLVLGSGSSTRRAILSELGLSFEVHKPGIDEKAIRRSSPEELVLALGKAKAAALLEGEHGTEFAAEGALLLTADQVVVWEGTILEKPVDEAEARTFIAGYGKAPARTVGSCVLTDAATGQQWAEVDTACVHFEAIPQSTVDKLITDGELFYCAGGLMVEHPLVAPHVTSMEGSIDSVMGLCKSTLVRMLDVAAPGSFGGGPGS